MLRRLGLQFARRGDEGHQRNVNENGVFLPELQPHLTNGFQKRQRLDVSHRAANLDDHDIHVVRDLAKCRLDLVGDVRDHLHRLAQKIAAALLRQDRFVNTAGGPVVIARQLGRGKPFVVSLVQIGFPAVIGDVNFAVLIRTHGPGIDVQVGIAFLEGDSEAPAFQQAADGRRGDAFAKGGNHTAGYKDILRTHPRRLRPAKTDCRARNCLFPPGKVGVHRILRRTAAMCQRARISSD